MRKHISDIDIVKINAYIIKETSPGSTFGISDPIGLQSLSKRLSENKMEMSVEAARLLLGIYRGDLFNSLNERTAWVSTVVFYGMNSYNIAFRNDDISELFDFLDTDASDDDCLDKIVQFLSRDEFVTEMK